MHKTGERASEFYLLHFKKRCVTRNFRARRVRDDDDDAMQVRKTVKREEKCLCDSMK
jgi:hypothetical protein